MNLIASEMCRLLVLTAPNKEMTTQFLFRNLSMQCVCHHTFLVCRFAKLVPAMLDSENVSVRHRGFASQMICSNILCSGYICQIC